MRKNHSKIVCIKLVHLPYLELVSLVIYLLSTFWHFIYTYLIYFYLSLYSVTALLGQGLLIIEDS